MGKVILKSDSCCSIVRSLGRQFRRAGGEGVRRHNPYGWFNNAFARNRGCSNAIHGEIQDVEQG